MAFPVLTFYKMTLRKMTITVSITILCVMTFNIMSHPKIMFNLMKLFGNDTQLNDILQNDT